MFFHEVLADCVNATFLTPPPSCIFSNYHTGLTCSPISLERNAWVDSYFCYLCELDFFTCSACFLTSKIRIMSISVTTFECDSQTSHELTCLIPHKTTMIIISTLFHRWENWHTVSIKQFAQDPRVRE